MTRPKRITPKQHAADRAHAEEATRPGTPGDAAPEAGVPEDGGLARVRRNALRHGSLAQALIPPPLERYEAAEDLAALLEALRDDLAPATPAEDLLVEAIAAGLWRLARLRRAEAEAIAAQPVGQPGRTQRDETDRPFSTRVTALSRALDDPPTLRRLLAQLGRPCTGLSDGSLRDIALQCIVDLQERDAERRARQIEAERARAGLPQLETALAFARYEAQLQRRIHHNLATFERLRRLRRRAVTRRPRHRSTLPGLRPSLPAGDPEASSSSRRQATRH